MKEPQHFFKRKQEFPNHFAQGINTDNAHECEARINLLSECLAHILCRLKIPYQLGDEVCHEGFFEYLSSAVKKNYPEGVQLYIGGGVVRSLLAYLYWYLHTKNVYAFPVFSTEEILLRLLENGDKRFHPTEVLGVGSDLDIYYIFPKVNEPVVAVISPLTEFNSALKLYDGGEQAPSATLLETFLTESVNAIEKAFHLNDYMDSLKKSFIPICDVKPYYAHLEHVMRQGGSHCDWLAFEFCGSAQGKDRFKIPEEDPAILHSLLIEGKYAYTSPKEGFNTTQKQTIRGCRGLLELPFVKISEPEVLTTELINLKNKDGLDYPANEQIEKLVRNSYFGAANNRVYRSKPNHPLAILGALSVEQHQKTNDPYLIPYFLPGFFRQSKKNDLELEAYLISREQFITSYTDAGTLYHGTSQTGLLSIIHSGFWISDSNLGQGVSAYGPGVYCTPLKTTAESYTKESTVHYLQIRLNPHYAPRILDWNKISETVRQSWENSSMVKGYTHVFLMLREEYSIDIIIHTHVILQNFYAIKVPHRPERLIQSRIDAVLSEFDQGDDLTRFTLFLGQIVPLHYLAQAAAIKLKDTLSTLTERYSSLFLIKAEYNPLASFHELNCQVEYLPALSQRMDVILDGMEETTVEELFLTSAKYGLMRLMTTLSKAGISINVCDEDGNTALHWAVNNERTDSVTWLVKNKSILTLSNHRGQVPLHLAPNKSSILPILKENDAYDFPLHLAAQEGKLDFLEELKNWSIDARDIFGWTPLHYAVLKGNTMMVDALLAQHADINLSTPEGKTVVYLAQEAKNAILLRCITRHKLASLSLSPLTLFSETFDEKYDFKDALIQYFLSSIFFENSPETQLEKLIKAIGIFLKEGKPQIALALIRNHQALLKIQVDYPKFNFFENINMTLRDLFDDTAEALDFLKPFITIDLIGMDKTSQFAIDIFLSAVKYNFEEVVLSYLSAGMDISLSKNYTGSALSLSIQYGHANLLKRLAEYGAIFSLSLSRPSLLDDDSLTENNSAIIIALRQIKEENDAHFLTHVAARTADLTDILALPEQDSSLFSYDRYGLNPLHYAAIEDHVEVMEALLQKGAVLAQLTFKGQTVFHLAAKHGKTSVITHFATQTDPAIWNVLDKKLNSVIHLAVGHGHADIITTLTTCTPTILCLPNRKGETPLELIWDRPRVKKNKLKLNRSAFFKEINNFIDNIDFTDIMSKMIAKNKKDLTSLPKNYQYILKILRSYRTFLYHSPLHVAAREGNNAAFEVELSEAEIHQKDFYGFTPLHYAALEGQVEIVYRLLEQNVRVDTACYGGCTALHLAIIAGHTKIVGVLIHYQATLTLPFYGKSSIKENLKKHHIFLKEKDKEYDGTTTYELEGYPIHMAVSKGCFDIVELLVNNKVDLSIANQDHETPLDIAWQKKDSDILALLIKHGAQLNDYKKGITLCHLAAAQEELSVIEILIQQGVELNAQDKEGLTPVHLAAAKGKAGVIDLFLKQGIFLNSLDKQGFTPLHWAIANGEIEVITQLVPILPTCTKDILSSLCSPELLREKYCETLLYFSTQNICLDKKLSQISLARIEKLVAAKMTQQGEKINSKISLADLAYLTGNTEVLKYILSESPEKTDWFFPEKILNAQNYGKYQGCFFMKSVEQYSSYENLIRARNTIEEEKRYYDENSFDFYDDYYEQDFYEPFSYDDDSHSDESLILLETDERDEEKNSQQNSLTM